LNITVHQVVALLAFIFSISTYIALRKFGVSDKISWGGGILVLLFVATFWSLVNLHKSEDDEDE
jgi:hypothetical protein